MLCVESLSILFAHFKHFGIAEDKLLFYCRYNFANVQIAIRLDHAISPR